MPGTKNPNNPSRFKKGQSGNPAGSSKRYRELKGLYRMKHTDVVELGTEILQGSLEELAAIKNDKTASVHKILLASLVVKAMQDRDHRIYSAILDRVIGKSREFSRVEHVGDGGGPVLTTQSLSIEEMQAELAAIRKRNKESDA